MSSSPTFSAQLIGKTEKALNAILEQLLTPTGLSEPQWVTLTVAVASAEALDRDEFASRMAGFLKVSDTQARTLIAELASTQLLELPDEAGSRLAVTEAGVRLQAQIRAATGEVTERLWSDLPGEDLAAAGRVLNTVLERANAELASAD